MAEKNMLGNNNPNNNQEDEFTKYRRAHGWLPEQQGPTADNDTIGNGALGHFVDAAQAGAAGSVGGLARFAGSEISPFGGDWLEGIADNMDEIVRRNTPTQELTGLNYIAGAAGNVVGSMLPNAAITLGMIATGNAVGAGAVVANVASKIPATARIIEAAKTMWNTPFSKYLVSNVAGSPLEAGSEAGNLITEMREKGYTDEEISAAAWKSAAYNTMWLTVANAIESKTLGKIADKFSGGAGLKGIGKAALAGAGTSGLSEGIQEYGQSYIGNAAEGVPFDEAAALEAAKQGAIGGAFLGAIGGGAGAALGVQPSDDNTQQPPAPPSDEQESIDFTPAEMAREHIEKIYDETDDEVIRKNITKELEEADTEEKVIAFAKKLGWQGPEQEPATKEAQEEVTAESTPEEQQQAATDAVNETVAEMNNAEVEEAPAQEQEAPASSVTEEAKPVQEKAQEEAKTTDNPDIEERNPEAMKAMAESKGNAPKQQQQAPSKPKVVGNNDWFEKSASKAKDKLRKNDRQKDYVKADGSFNTTKLRNNIATKMWLEQHPEAYNIAQKAFDGDKVAQETFAEYTPLRQASLLDALRNGKEKYVLTGKDRKTDEYHQQNIAKAREEKATAQTPAVAEKPAPTETAKPVPVAKQTSAKLPTIHIGKVDMQPAMSADGKEVELRAPSGTTYSKTEMDDIKAAGFIYQSGRGLVAKATPAAREFIKSYRVTEGEEVNGKTEQNQNDADTQSRQSGEKQTGNKGEGQDSKNQKVENKSVEKADEKVATTKAQSASEVKSAPKVQNPAKEEAKSEPKQEVDSNGVIRFPRNVSKFWGKKDIEKAQNANSKLLLDKADEVLKRWRDGELSSDDARKAITAIHQSYTDSTAATPVYNSTFKDDIYKRYYSIGEHDKAQRDAAKKAASAERQQKEQEARDKRNDLTAKAQERADKLLKQYEDGEISADEATDKLNENYLDLTAELEKENLPEVLKKAKEKFLDQPIKAISRAESEKVKTSESQETSIKEEPAKEETSAPATESSTGEEVSAVDEVETKKKFKEHQRLLDKMLKDVKNFYNADGTLNEQVAESIEAGLAELKNQPKGYTAKQRQYIQTALESLKAARRLADAEVEVRKANNNIDADNYTTDDEFIAAYNSIQIDKITDPMSPDATRQDLLDLEDVPAEVEDYASSFLTEKEQDNFIGARTGLAEINTEILQDFGFDGELSEGFEGAISEYPEETKIALRKYANKVIKVLKEFVKGGVAVLKARADRAEALRKRALDDVNAEEAGVKHKLVPVATASEVEQSYNSIVARITKAFGAKKVEQLNGDKLRITAADGSKYIVNVAEEIIVNEAMIEDARASHGIDSLEEIVVEGMYRPVHNSDIKGIIDVSTYGKKGTEIHEVTHAVIDNVLTKRENDALFNRAEKLIKELGLKADAEEVACDAVQAFVIARENGYVTTFTPAERAELQKTYWGKTLLNLNRAGRKAQLFSKLHQEELNKSAWGKMILAKYKLQSLLGKIFAKIYDFVKAAQSMFEGVENFHNIARRIETGKVWERNRSNGKGNVKYQAVGKHSATANVERLKVAEKMLADGESMETIFDATGWWQGEDLQWRYEIPDYLDRIDDKRFLKMAEGKPVNLSEVYDNQELYAAYPQLRNYRVEVVDKPQAGWQGLFENSTIFINRSVSKNRPLTLLHELQHVIQDIEGFATGGTPRDVLGYAGNQRSKLEDALYDMYDKIHPQFATWKDRLAAIEEREKNGKPPKKTDATSKPKLIDKIKKAEEEYSKDNGKELLDAIKEAEKFIQNISDVLGEAEKQAKDTVANHWDNDLERMYEFEYRLFGAKRIDLARYIQSEYLYDALYGEQEARAASKRAEDNSQRYPWKDFDGHYNGRSLVIVNPYKKFASEQRAWQGSRAIFDYYDSGYINTGEGAQAYAYGHYFAQDRNTAEGYRKALAGDPKIEFNDTGEFANLTPNEQYWLEIAALDAPIVGHFGMGRGDADSITAGSIIKSYLLDTIKVDIDVDDMFKRVESRLDALKTKLNEFKKIKKTALSLLATNPDATFQELVDALDKGKAKPSIQDIQQLVDNNQLTIEDIAAATQPTLGDSLKYYFPRYDSNSRVEDFIKELYDEIAIKESNTSSLNLDIDIARKLLNSKIADEPLLRRNNSTGALYEVEIPDDNVLLDFEKAFWEQPQKVQDALIDLLSEITDADMNTIVMFAYKGASRYASNMTNNTDYKKYSLAKKRIYEMLEGKIGSAAARSQTVVLLNSPGRTLHDAIARVLDKEDYNSTHGSKELSALLNKHGIEGVTYVGGRDGRCFVVFNDKAIEIIKRNNEDIRKTAAKYSIRRRQPSDAASRTYENKRREGKQYANVEQELADSVHSKERKGLLERGKDWLNNQYKNFYRNMFDKYTDLKVFDKAYEEETGKHLAEYNTIRGKTQYLANGTQGALDALILGTKEQMELLQKQYGLKHLVSFKMIMEKLLGNKDKYEKYMLDKFAEAYKEDADAACRKAFGTYLVARQLLEGLRNHRLEYQDKVAKWQEKGGKGRKPEYKEYQMPEGWTEAKCQEFIKSAPQAFKYCAEMYYKYNENLLEMMEKCHIIDKELHQTLNDKYKEYCPLMRDFEDTEAVDSYINEMTSGGKSITNVASPLKRRRSEGSKRDVIDPLEMTMQATSNIVSRCKRNEVGLLLVKRAREANLTDLVKRVKGDSSDAKNCIFTVMRNGKKEAYQTTQELYPSVTHGFEPSVKINLALATVPAKLLRAGSTMSPSFIVRNLVRDTIFAAISSKNGFIPIVDSLRGACELYNNPQFRAEFKNSGVISSAFYGDRESIAQAIDDMNDGKFNILNPVDVVKGSLKGLERFSNFVEAATRAGEFLKAKKNGKSDAQAAYEAIELTLNFNRSGVEGQQINRIVPFFNACLQGGDKLVRLLKDDPKGTAAKIGKYIILPSLFLWAKNHDEDWYKELDPNIKNTCWILSEDVRIPKPQEAGVIFGSGTEAMLDMAYEQDPEAMKNWADTFLGNLAPSIIPTVLLPFIEWNANYSFFRGKPVVNQGQQKLPTELQYGSYTTEASKFVGKTVGVSPLKLDNAIRSVTGTMGMFLWQTPDWFAAEKQNLPAKKLSEMQFVRDFTINEMNKNRTMTDFYELADAADRQHRGYGKKGKPTKEVQAVGRAKRLIDKINMEKRDITNSKTLNPMQKRAMIERKEQEAKRIAGIAIKKYGKYFDD